MFVSIHSVICVVIGFEILHFRDCICILGTHGYFQMIILAYANFLTYGDCIMRNVAF